MPWPGMADGMLGVAVRTFSQSDEEGETLVTYLPKVGSSYALTAVFDRAHVEVDPSTGAAVSSNNPTLGVQLSQMQAEFQKGDRVQVGSVIYKISDFQRDGVAGALLILNL